MRIIDTTDVLVLGSGGAGCRAALEASIYGVKVSIVNKGNFGKSGTTAYKVAETAGYNAADGIADPTDNSLIHYNDIINAGLGMTYNNLAQILADDALKTLKFFKNHGIELEKKSDTNEYVEVTGCFASKPRMHILKGHGEPIIKALVELIKKNKDIKIYENLMATKILTENNNCTGVILLDKLGNLSIIKAKAIIIATGGGGQLFKNTLTPSDITGDGYKLALGAGAELVNMEFMQVVLGTIYPTKNQLNTFLWCAEPKLNNSYYQEFLEKYLPKHIDIKQVMNEKASHFPFSSRDNSKYIEISVKKEILKGNGTKNNGVYLDLTHITDDYLKKIPKDSPLHKYWLIIKEHMKKRGFKIDKEPVEISCFAHAINGGIKIGDEGETSVKGLFAAGEIAGGPHGADRLGGNMLLASQVFGARAGKSAANFSLNNEVLDINKDIVLTEYNKLNELLTNKDKSSIEKIKDEMKEIMWNNVLIYKNKELLLEAQQKIVQLKYQLKNCCLDDKSKFWDFCEVSNMLNLAEIIIMSSEHRKESRGSHYREDYPCLNEKYNFKIIIKNEKGRFIIKEE